MEMKHYLEFPCLSWNEEPGTGHNTPDVASPVQNEGEDNFPQSADHTLF